MQFEAPTPILRSFDEAKAKEFYLDFLGFELVFEHRFEPELPLYLSVRRGQCEIHLSEHFGDAAPGAVLRIAMTDVAGFCTALNAKNYKHARPEFQDQIWGWRDMTISDPFGNRLIFCEPGENLADFGA